MSMFSFSTALLAAFVASHVQLAYTITRVCKGGFEEIGGCCYKFIEFTEDDLAAGSSDVRKNWEDANTDCKGMFGLLMTTGLAQVGTENSCNDVKLMEEVARRGPTKEIRYWFGATNGGSPDGEWLWQRDTNIIFPKTSNMWGKEQPSGTAKLPQNCLASESALSKDIYLRAYFDDEPCDNLYNYVCQIFE